MNIGTKHKRFRENVLPIKKDTQDEVTKAALGVVRKITPEQVLGALFGAGMGYCQYVASYELNQPYYYTNRVMNVVTAYFTSGKKGPLSEDAIQKTRELIAKARAEGNEPAAVILEKYLWAQKANPLGIL